MKIIAILSVVSAIVITSCKIPDSDDLYINRSRKGYAVVVKSVVKSNSGLFGGTSTTNSIAVEYITGDYKGAREEIFDNCYTVGDTVDVVFGSYGAHGVIKGRKL